MTLALVMGRTVAELQASMSDVEFVHWREYWRLYPFDDLHRYHRPAALISSGDAKQRQKAFEADLEFLQPAAPDPDLAGYSAAELKTFRAFGIKPPPRPAKE